ncbi:hypothetical protein [Microcoleus sp. S13_C3]|uniref:hypothetical protein n=1 Tax=Microcoleus sp. S13_C3 TaxID=3055409 RepID=UPI002FD6893C
MLSLSILYQSLKPDRRINKKPDRPHPPKSDRRSTKNPIAHPQKTRSPIHKKPVETQKTPAVGNRSYTDKTRLRGLKISPDDFQSPNTLFVRVGGHRLCRRGF